MCTGTDGMVPSESVPPSLMVSDCIHHQMADCG
jgi:hypothetical protein